MKKLLTMLVVFWLGLGIGKAQMEMEISPVGNIYMIGNTHIDAVWLWDREETKWVCEDTFFSVLDLMRSYPEVHFSQSSAQFYQWVQKNNPKLFEKIQAKVKEGKWEIVGGMWIEPDGNMPSGESLVRQILYGQQYFKDNFGVEAKVAWLPDTFGLNWNFPQIFKKCGINYFLTSKLNWNDTNNFPYNIFWWQSPDGSKILACQTPGQYNEEVNFDRMMEQMQLMKERHNLNDLIYLYGLGDHGGGPNMEMMERAKEFSYHEDFPKLNFCNSIDYFKKVEESGKEFPVWNDELYLEFHRGTLTNHPKIKYYNRKSEVLLNEAETFAIFARQFNLNYPVEGLEELWKKVLFNQFHDILPGTSIKKGMDDALNDYQEVMLKGETILNSSLSAIANNINISDVSKAIVIFNPLSWDRDDLVEIKLNDLGVDKPYIFNLQNRELVPSQIIEEEGVKKIIFVANDVPSFGYCTYEITSGEPEEQFSTDLNVKENIIENQYYQVEIDKISGLVNILDKNLNKQIVKDGNMFCAFEDNAEGWLSPWNIGDKVKNNVYSKIENLVSLEILEEGPVRIKVRVKYNYQNSVIESDIILYSGLKQIDFETKINWQEKDTLLKVAFPYNFSSKDDLATYEIPFGSIARKIIDSPQANNFEKAKYEMSGLRWVDVSCAEYGISLLNDSKYGFDVRDNMLRMSILRAKKYPDPSILGLPSLKEEYFGLGEEKVRYGLYSHQGEWKEGDIVKKGREFNYPLLVNFQNPHQGELPLSLSFLRTSPENIILTGLKKAENSLDTIIRFYESEGEEVEAEIVFLQNKVTKSWETDMLENNISEISLQDLGESIKVIRVKTKPYEIKTVKASFYGDSIK